MPFTPFHVGPAVFIKALYRKFSLTMFVFSQIVMDCEPLYFMLRDEFPVHRLFHTFLGCNIVVLISVSIGMPFCNLALRILQLEKMMLKQAFIGAAVGAYSHVILDGLMHRDMQPFWPLIEGNPMLGYVYGKTIYDFCLMCVAAGGTVFILKKLKTWAKTF